MKQIVRERNGKTSAWTKMPDGTEWNIWDFEHGEYTENVSKAIDRSYYLGRLAFKQEVSRIKDY
jgi:hypothetical protein